MEFSELRLRMKNYYEEKQRLRSCQVSAPTLDEAMTEASSVLTVPSQELHFEIVARGRRGVFGFFHREWTLRAFAPSAEESVPAFLQDEVSGRDFSLSGLDLAEEAQEEVLVEPRAPGEYALYQQGDQLFVWVLRSADGEIPDEQEILDAFFTRYGEGSPHSEKKLREALEKSVSELESVVPVAFAQVPHSVSSDAILRLKVDGESCYMTAVAPKEEGSDVCQQLIKEKMISEGIDERCLLLDRMRAFEKSPVYGQPYLIAHAVELIPGTNGVVKLIYEEEGATGGTFSGESASVMGSVTGDVSQGHSFRSIAAGSVAATYYPPKPGRNGVSLNGEERKAPEGHDAVFRIGQGLKPSKEDSNIAIATVDGVLYRDRSGLISVVERTVIKGNIDFQSHGNLYVLGSLEVQGNIEDGVTVYAESDIVVTGYIGKSQVTTDGNLSVKRGITGSYEQSQPDQELSFTIRVAGKLSCDFITNGSIYAGGGVSVKNGIVGSIIYSGGIVRCQGSNGKVLGSMIAGKDKIVISEIGGQTGAGTVLTLGSSPYFLERVQSISVQKHLYKKELSSLKAQVISASKEKAADEASKAATEKVQARLDAIVAISEGLEQELEALSDHAAFFNEQAAALALRQVNSGVRVEFRQEFFDIRMVSVQPLYYYYDAEEDRIAQRALSKEEVEAEDRAFSDEQDD